MVEVFQLLVGGIAQGCVYGLIALGFVLIYKATEMVNFAQGDLMMLGTFVAFSCIGTWGMNYWAGLAAAALAMAAFGYLLDAVVLRRIIGQPQFAVVILTISLGFLFRSAAGFIWGHETLNFPDTPFTNRMSDVGGVILSWEHLSIIFGTLILAGLLYLFFNYTRLGNAMLAFLVRDIDGQPVMANSEREIEAMIDRLDDDGLGAVAKCLIEDFGVVTEGPEAVKN